MVFGFQSIMAIPTLSVVPSENLMPPPPENESLDRYKEQPTDQLSFMGRIANWFGFGSNSATDDDTLSSNNRIISNLVESSQYYSDPHISSSSDIQQRYYDQPSSFTTSTGRKVKITCNPCNKVPWTPMMGGQQQLPYFKTQNLNTNYAAQYQHVPVENFQYQPQPPSPPKPQKNFAPSHNHASYNTFSNNNYPQTYKNQQILSAPQILIPTYASGKLRPNLQQQAVYNNRITSPEYKPPPQLLPVQDTNPHLIPIPIPNLSITPIPPIFSSKPFRNIIKFNINNVDSQHRDHYTQNYNAAAKLPASIQDLLPPQPPTDSYGASAISDSDIEIIKSVSLGEYKSTIEYPPAVIQSPVIDFTENRLNQKNIFATAATHYAEYITEPIIVDPEDSLLFDNFPAASSNNDTEFNGEKSSNNEYIAKFSTATYEPKLFETTTIIPMFINEKQVNETYKNVENTKRGKNDRGTSRYLVTTPISNYLRTSPSDFSLTTIPKLNYSNSLQSTRNGLWTPTNTARPFTVASNPTTFLTSKSLENRQLSIDKKPKQIQIIIPYSTKNQPRPFEKKQNFDSASGWSYQTNDFHDSQESKVVESTANTERALTYSPQATQRRTTKYLTKVKASNLRELLANEGKTTIDLSKLQKSIDGWTEQEFSMLPNRASTISLRGHPKIIPSNCFPSTVPSVFIKRYTTVIPSESETIITTVEPLFAHEKFTRFDDSKLLDKNRLDFQQETTRLAKSSRDTVSNSKNIFWNDLKTVISPITKEKVYVVTPQPWNDNDDSDLVGDFKSPRFSVRPTPGSSAEVKSSISKSGI